ncbi:hypothetical protein R3P38DRAFT_2793540 [Favolaschia claudopus]|uniref:Uncharacterized protein n=1 Tax=Favolaschia claudopus TaxID=2862362 RepID=A0AAW0ADA4_9AGAR
MTHFNPTPSGGEHSTPAATNTEANNTAAAFETVLKTLTSHNLSHADARTVAAFQRVLDVVTGYKAPAESTGSADLHVQPPSSPPGITFPPPAAFSRWPVTPLQAEPAGTGSPAPFVAPAPCACLGKKQTT